MKKVYWYKRGNTMAHHYNLVDIVHIVKMVTFDTGFGI